MQGGDAGHERRIAPGEDSVFRHPRRMCLLPLFPILFGLFPILFGLFKLFRRHAPQIDEARPAHLFPQAMNFAERGFTLAGLVATELSEQIPKQIDFLRGVHRSRSGLPAAFRNNFQSQ